MKRKSSLIEVNLNSIEAIGLDVAKEKIDVCLLWSWQPIYYRIKNNSQAISEFSKELREWGLDEEVPMVLESTGIYHLELALTLMEDWWEVKEINPIITHQQIRCTIRGTKTDKTDALLLAELWKYKWNELRTFSRSRKIISLRKKMSILNEIEKKILEFSMIIKWYEEERLKSWEIGEEDEYMKMIKESLKMIKKSKVEIEKSIMEEELDEKWNRKVEIIDSITWISSLIAKMCYWIFWENEFKNKKEMLAYVWLDPRLRQSWKSAWNYKMSKRWNSFIRKKLYQAAFCSIHHSEYYKWIYEREKQKWKHHFICVLTIARKMIYTMRSLIQKNELYNPNYYLNSI